MSAGVLFPLNPVACRTVLLVIAVLFNVRESTSCSERQNSLGCLPLSSHSVHVTGLFWGGSSGRRTRRALCLFHTLTHPSGCFYKHPRTEHRGSGGAYNARAGRAGGSAAGSGLEPRGPTPLAVCVAVGHGKEREMCGDLRRCSGQRVT